MSSTSVCPGSHSRTTTLQRWTSRVLVTAEISTSVLDLVVGHACRRAAKAWSGCSHTETGAGTLTTIPSSIGRSHAQTWLERYGTLTTPSYWRSCFPRPKTPGNAGGAPDIP